MTRGQRVLAFGGILALAFFLHTAHCEWHFKTNVGQVGRINYVRRPILTYEHGVIATRPTRSGGTRPSAWVKTGLFAQSSTETAMTWGVAIPLFLLGLNAFLVMGWRHQSRVARGLCPQCSYDLRGDRKEPADICPECGWQRSS